MIHEYIDAFRENKRQFEKWVESIEEEITYIDILRQVINLCLNPKYVDTLYELDEDKITEIDNGDYQGTLIYLIPRNCYQPMASDYVYTSVFYGSCSGCDALLAAQDWDYCNIKYNVDMVTTIALHLVENMKWLEDWE